jgi:predicted MFS family arabinose efflux permease
MKDKNNYLSETLSGFTGLGLYVLAFWWPRWSWVEYVCWFIFALGTLGLFSNRVMQRIKDYYECNWFFTVSLLQMLGAIAIFYFNQPHSTVFGVAYLIFLIVSFTRMILLPNKN